MYCCIALGKQRSTAACSRRNPSYPSVNSREARFRDTASSNDARGPFQRDRDRVLYSPEFRRLSGVTQVVSASEGDIFHNRLTHSLKVAQVGRRLAERLLKEYPSECEAWGGLDPDVVETAGLAHDLGHPPFGHDGEEVIFQSVVKRRQRDGFEGNAQSFRIVTRLAAHTDNYPDLDSLQGPAGDSGLNLTRATLNAILKYPWTRGKPKKGRKKWGAYNVDKDRFKWVRYGQKRKQLSLEAELMDWADDVTYAVHDLEDFYRAGLIPIHLLSRATERDKFIEASIQRGTFLRQDSDILSRVLRVALGPYLYLDTPYDGGHQHRSIINEATSGLITQFITGRAIRIREPSANKSVAIDRKARRQIDLLKEITRYYVIDNPRIASIREGQREMLSKLFEIYLEVVDGKRKQALLPQWTRDRLDSGDKPPRLVADLLAGMTERQVIQTYQRLTGIVPGPMSYFDL